MQRILFSFSTVGLVAIFAVGLTTGCPSEIQLNNNYEPDAAWTHDCDLNGDHDQDGIRNDHEGCMYGTDTDNDGIPDYQDNDSDNDGLSDKMEAGDSDINTPPTDYDGDGIPDYLDTDSDNDGVADGDEDRNHDGLVGLCMVECPNMNPEECGPGQACLATGLCDPPVTFECSQGETDPLNPDTDGDGISDSKEGSLICNLRSEFNPVGRRAVQHFTPNAGKFQIGVDEMAFVQEQSITNRSDENCSTTEDEDGDSKAGCDDTDCHNTSACGASSVTFDLDDPQSNTAGFAFTRKPLGSDVQEENTLIISELIAALGSSNVILRASGASKILLEEYPTVVRAMVDLVGMSATTTSVLRNNVMSILMGKLQNEFTNLPIAFGATASNFVLSYSVQLRTPAPEQGEPYIVVMGAISTNQDYTDSTKTTKFNVDDAANGSGLAAPGNGYEAECESYLVSTQPIADILWIIDESGSMNQEQQSVAANAVNFFNRAIAYGLDFRMGITDVHEHNDGILCTAQGQSNDHFLTPTDLTQFQDCILQPWGSLTQEGGSEHGITQGYNAIVNHLPRADAPNRIRPEAQLVIIYVSDEAAQEVQTSCGSSPDSACIMTEIQPTLNLLLGSSNPEAEGTAHAIVGPPPSGCATADLGSGYVEIATATGGQIASVCQTDLGSTLQIIIEDIVANSSPVVLHHYPISVSVAAAKDGVALERSRVDGFDYRSSANTIVFVNQVFDPLFPSEVVVSYERWTTEIIPPD